MTATRVPQGLYAISSPQWGTGRALLAHAAAVIRGGAVMLQYRDKQVGGRANRLRRLQEACGLAVICEASGVPLIINDDLPLAIACGAAGVHLGRHDLRLDIQRLNDLRTSTGDDLLIGVSCYDDLARARLAARAGADYLSFGALYASRTKPRAPRCPVLALRAARRLQRPVCAIGGINQSNIGRVAAAGASLVAVIGALADNLPDNPRGRRTRAEDVQAAAHSLQSRWQMSYQP